MFTNFHFLTLIHKLGGPSANSPLPLVGEG